MSTKTLLKRVKKIKKRIDPDAFEPIVIIRRTIAPNGDIIEIGEETFQPGQPGGEKKVMVLKPPYENIHDKKNDNGPITKIVKNYTGKHQTIISGDDANL